MPEDATLSKAEGSNGFLSIIKDFAAETLGGFAKLLPVWASQQLELQSKDQLFDPTFTGTVEPGFSTSPSAPPQINITVPEALGGGQIKLNQLLVVGAGIALGFVFFFNR